LRSGSGPAYSYHPPSGVSIEPRSAGGVRRLGRGTAGKVARAVAVHYRRIVLAPAKYWIAAVAVAAGMAPATASASEGEGVLSLGLGYVGYTLSDQEHTAGGARLGLEYERGLTDALWLRGQAGVGGYPLGEWSVSGDASAGITYAIDVLKYVPYVKAGLGALLVGGEAVDTSVYPLIEAGAGLDVLHSRSLSYGLEARVEAFFEGSAFFTAGARVSYRWGFF
jgi:hypothetical protein